LKKRFLLATLGVLAGIPLLEGALRTPWWRYFPGQDFSIRVLAFGDDLVRGNFAGNENYPGRLEALLRESCPKSTILVVNGGQTGARSDDLVRSLPTWLGRAHHPQVVALLLGMNDFQGDGRPVAAVPVSRFRVKRLAEALFAFATHSREPGASQAEAPFLAQLSRLDYHRIVTRPLLEERRFGELEEIHRAVLKENPLQHAALLDLGDLMRSANRAEQALEAHRIAAQDQPDDPWATFAVVADLEALRRVPEALDASDPLLAKAALIPVPLVVSLAAFYRQNSDKARLEALLQNAVKRDGPQLVLHALSARSRDWAGNKRGAKASRALAAKAALAPYPASLKQNYSVILQEAVASGATALALMVPGRSAAPLEEIVPPGEVLSLEKPFDDLVAKAGFDSVFTDATGGNFGHLTKQGNELLAELVRQRLLTTEPVRSLCRK
jgi:lysophospholipase L1-like esterase